MNLEIGMYVRTINGKIWIIKSQKAISGHRKDIINASYNLIDLIEIGDYVNGCKIIELATNIDGKVIYLETDIIEFDNAYACGNINIYEKDIKSIVTKEQFESIKYEVE